MGENTSSYHGTNSEPKWLLQGLTIKSTCYSYDDVPSNNKNSRSTLDACITLQFRNTFKKLSHLRVANDVEDDCLSASWVYATLKTAL